MKGNGWKFTLQKEEVFLFLKVVISPASET